MKVIIPVIVDMLFDIGSVGKPPTTSRVIIPVIVDMLFDENILEGFEKNIVKS